MGLGSIFVKPEMGTNCEVCGLRFDVVKGGACEKCRRVMCATHLHGSFARRLLVDLGAPAICVQCRAGITPPKENSRTE